MISGKWTFFLLVRSHSKLRPYLRKVATAPFKGLCSADMYPSKPKPGITRGYLQAILLSEQFTNYADTLSRRARMPKLNQDQLFSYVAPIPSEQAQQRFVKQVSEAETTIGDARRALSGLGEAVLNALPSAIFW